jgi:hypothetical protein
MFRRSQSSFAFATSIAGEASFEMEQNRCENAVVRRV